MAICENTYFPFKIENIGIRNGPFPKEYYWEYFQINKNNKILHKYKRCSKFELLFNVPEMPQNYTPLNVAIHFRNLRQYEVSYEMKRVQLCDCKYVSKQITANKFKQVFNCKHRKILQILPFDGVAEPNGLITLNIEFQYDLEGVNDLQYTMNSIGFSLKWRFHFDVKSCDPTIMILTKTLLPMQLRDAYPVHQAIWLFNPFCAEIAIGVENLTDHLEVLQIVTKDIILKPNELSPLIVAFDPLEIKKYRLELLFKWIKMLDDIEESFVCGDFGIKIDAQCTNTVKRFVIRHSPNETVSCLLTPVILIPNHLNIELKQTTSISKIIKIENNSKDCARYSWIPLYLANYYKIDVKPACGTIKSGKFKKFEITIKSEGNACCLTDILLKCDIYKYAKEIKQKPIYPSGYFEYTEKYYCEKVDSPPISRNKFMFQTNVSINLRVFDAMNIDEFLSIPDQLELNATNYRMFSPTAAKIETEFPELIDKKFLDKMLWMTLASAELNFDLDIMGNSETIECTEEENLFEESVLDENDNLTEKCPKLTWPCTNASQIPP